MDRFFPGVRPNDPNRARLYFRMFKKAGAVAPASADYSNFSPIGMLGNGPDDSVSSGFQGCGDCVYACDGHITEQQTDIGQGAETVVTGAEAVSVYSAQTGYDPSTGANDNGDTVQNGLDYMRKTGFSGHKVAAFAQLDITNLEDVKLAVSEFGAVDLALNFPSSAMGQFNSGQEWDVVANDGGSLGGHCVLLVAYDDTSMTVVTWGKLQKMTYAFFVKYFVEAWALISEAWVNNASGRDPEGVDKYAFGTQFAALTGQPNPFPAPTPTPTPGPCVDDADKQLAAVLYSIGWAYPPELVDALNAWLAAKNL